MASIVQLKRSALTGKVPGTGSLNLGELALNTYDGKIFFRRSGSTDTVQEVITTNVLNTGSVTITGTLTAGSIVGSISASNGVVSGSSQVIGILSSLNSYTSSINVWSSSLATTGSNTFVGTQTFNNDVTILGAVNARQFNISVISSSVLFESGSSRFGNSSDDTHQFTGSVQVTGSLYVNGSQVGVAPGPNTYDFNLDPNAAGTVNYITDSTSNTLALAQTGSFDVKISNVTRLSVSSSAMWVTTGSITSNYMHLAKYITNGGDLDFNI
jgi:hypothetical protein